MSLPDGGCAAAHPTANHVEIQSQFFQMPTHTPPSFSPKLRSNLNIFISLLNQFINYHIFHFFIFSFFITKSIQSWKMLSLPSLAAPAADWCLRSYLPAKQVCPHPHLLFIGGERVAIACRCGCAVARIRLSIDWRLQITWKKNQNNNSKIVLAIQMRLCSRPQYDHSFVSVVVHPPTNGFSQSHRAPPIPIVPQSQRVGRQIIEFDRWGQI